jgi:hypothetical protein
VVMAMSGQLERVVKPIYHILQVNLSSLTLGATRTEVVRRSASQ